MEYTLLTSDLTRKARRAIAEYTAKATGQPEKTYALHMAMTGRHIISNVPLDTIINLANQINDDENCEFAVSPSDDSSDDNGADNSDSECAGVKSNESTTKDEEAF